MVENGGVNICRFEDRTSNEDCVERKLSATFFK